MVKLPHSFFQDENVVSIAKSLLGMQLYTNINGEVTGGTIVETEAYEGIIDKASHAYGGRFTNRTQTMYEEGGVAYVYLCYGIHYLFNVVTANLGTPHAVLIRGLEPISGLSIMLRRRKMPLFKSNVTTGPGALAAALGINKEHNGSDLTGDEVWLEDNGTRFSEQEILAVPRVGVDYAEDHASLPYRFYVKGNKFVSKPVKGI